MNNEEREMEKKVDKSFFQRAWKPIVAAVVALCILGGGGLFLWERHEDRQEEKAKVAESDLIKAEAKTEKVKLISEKEVQDIVSKKIDVPLDKITFDHIRLEKEGKGKHGTSKTEEATPSYVYEVKCTANSLHYELDIDAVSGNVLDAEVDD